MSIVNRKSNYIQSHGRLLAFGLSLASLAISGCGIATSSSSTSGTSPVSVTQGKITGTVYGGQSPIIGSTIQVYAIGTTGRKTTATPLLTQTVTTTAPNGSFSISGLYYQNCTPTSQIYITATQGVSSGSTNNSAIALMAPLGLCSTVYQNAQNGVNTTISLNEVTAVGSAYALANYMSSYTSVGAPSTTDAGYANAVANFYNLVNLSTGMFGGTSLPAGAVIPTAELNTLANMIASCVGSSSSTSTPCNMLLTATGATNTMGAALAFAKNPTSPALLALFATLSQPTAPFQPTLSAAPNDWTVAIKYNGNGNLSGPYGIAIDAAGNAWVTNSTGSTITELSSSGTYVNSFSATGLLGPKGIAIDRTGNIWVANPTGNNIFEFNTSGTSQTYTAGGLSGPVSLALDSGGNAWIANQNGNSVTELGPSGSAVQTSLNPSSSISTPSGISLDTAGSVYVANNGSGTVAKLTHAGAFSATLTDVALQGATAVNVDANGNVLALGSTTGTAVAGSVSRYTTSGTVASASPYSGSGLSLPVGIASGASTSTDVISVIANGGTSGSLTTIDIASSGGASLIGPVGSLNTPVGVAIDLSGSVWTANSGENTVAQFIGFTVPVTTPIAANVGP